MHRLLLVILSLCIGFAIGYWLGELPTRQREPYTQPTWSR